MPKPDDSLVSWRDRPLLTLKVSAELAGCSTATLYGAAARGELTFKRLGGRTLVETASLLRYLDSAAGWEPDRTKVDAANVARKSRARTAWGR